MKTRIHSVALCFALSTCACGDAQGTEDDALPTSREDELSQLEYKRLIERAMTAEYGPAPDLTRELQPDDVSLSKEVRSAFARATREIESRSFENADYSAGVAGYYAVYATKARARVVAYAVWGVGGGEPDYQDAMVIGYRPSGRRVYFVERSF